MERKIRDNFIALGAASAAFDETVIKIQKTSADVRKVMEIAEKMSLTSAGSVSPQARPSLLFPHKLLTWFH